MGSRLKEDEKNERIIRNLLKIPENRRCINCNSLGPQYVCTNFSTFVCTTCSGIHREFTHRVKSVSMAKFTPQEVSALQGGGNASAREIYLKEWDPQRNSLPDASNVERLRDFIKHVYVDRRYTGERKPEKSLRENMGESGDFNGNRRTDSSQGGSRSPPYEDPERRYGERPSAAGRSPGYDQEVRRYSDNKKSPARAEVVNDWRREDRFGNTRRSEDSSDGGSKLGGRSPDSQRDSSDISSPPVVRPVRDILGDNVSPLRVIEPPKATVAKATDGSAHTQRTASSSSLASADGNPSEVKVEASLIDFDSVPEPPATVTTPQAQVATDAHVQTAALSDHNWANFDSVPQVKVNTASSNSVESVLLGLSIPASTTGLSSSVGIAPLQSSGSPDSSSGSSFGFFAPPDGNASASLGPAPQLTDYGGSLFANAHTGGQWPSMNPQQPSRVPGGSGQPFLQPVAPATGGSSSNRPWNQPVAPHPHMPLGASGAQVGQAGIRPAMDTSLQPASKPSLNAQSGGRKELPQDLFAMNYSYMPPPVSGWYSGSPYGAGVSMQYQMPLAVPNTQPVSRSTNPFDFGSEPPSVQPSAFPSMAPLQGALPSSATPSGPLRASSLGTASANAPAMFTEASPYASAIPPRPYLGQETFGSMAPRPQGPFGFGLDDPAFASLNPNHQLGGPHPSHSSSSNFTSTGGSGNPFG